ncbi:beta carbonic anhydrase 1 isoform X4 [Apis cerana]|uniref:beta carbonic anhydrase 1 isoform X4 n=1 Tax=Apis cerana TaxID=7461 RepID=UPI0007E2DCEC|nr:beta carbonic anhydrase 1 isoform X4 [Apis cerana]
MDKIIKGIMKYRKCHREEMVKQFQKVKDCPEPKAAFFTCMDSRMIPTRFTETNVGDMFVGTRFHDDIIFSNMKLVFL